MADVVITAAVRSAVGRALKGALANTRPDELAGQVIRAALAKVPALNPAEVDDVVLGCAMPEGEQGLNIARVAALLGGLPIETSAVTVNRFCSSGLQAIAQAAERIAFGSADVIVAGGVESMTMVPMTGNKLSVSPEAMDRHPTAYTPMGLTAEAVAQKFGITREMQDALAVKSHARAAAAQREGKFTEIVPVQAVHYEVKDGKAVRATRTFDKDEFVRPDTTMESLGKLRPAFSATGTVTAGNSSPLSDGAAAVVVMSRAKAEALGIKPLAYFRAFQVAGVPPEIMGIGPVPAVQKLLAKTGLSIGQIDLIEMNEAFASQAAYCQRQLEIPDEKLNVNGGAIALGHPLGCTGAKLSATLLAELARRNGRYGIVTMCIGGGMGAAGLFERAG
ncbi:MAG: thiolase family protein [Deltaproteobacteria bacterium]|nr:thiolase family protein [Deltaproteobacteria bacterium]